LLGLVGIFILTILSELIKEKEKNNLSAKIEIIKQISPTAWQHINFMGRYEFNVPQKEINISEIVKRTELYPIICPTNSLLILLVGLGGITQTHFLI
jgi:hypothetical protein